MFETPDDSIIFNFPFFALSVETTQNVAPQSSQKSIVEVSVDRGSKVHLPCNVHAYPVPTITWYRLSDSGSYYPIPSTQRIMPSQSLLYVRSADERDAGRWVSFEFGSLFHYNLCRFYIPNMNMKFRNATEKRKFQLTSLSSLISSMHRSAKLQISMAK